MVKHVFVIIYLFVTSYYAQDTIKINFIVNAPGLGESEKVFISGNVSELGMWHPDKIELKKDSEQLWMKTILLKKGITVEYKFTKGSWASEALNPDLTLPSNSILKVEHDTTIRASITRWSDKSTPKIKGQITGKVEYIKNFTIDGLKPRDIIIWLPPGYGKMKSKRYPVLYMHDGQNIVDPRTSTMYNDWQLDETADSLIRKGKIRPIIIVGIYNTEDRSQEYKDTQLGRLYMKGLVEKLKPLIDSKYRTLSDRQNTTVGGSSLGGLISFMCAWEYPDVFSKAACFSPAFKIDNIDYVKNVIKYSGEKKNISFFIYNGGIDLDEQLQPGVDLMIEALKQKGFREGKDLFVDINKLAQHNETFWAKEVGPLLKTFYGNE